MNKSKPTKPKMTWGDLMDAMEPRSPEAIRRRGRLNMPTKKKYKKAKRLDVQILNEEEDRKLLIKAMMVYSEKYGKPSLAALLLAYANVMNELEKNFES